MFPRTPIAIWQEFAQGKTHADEGFAMGRRVSDDAVVIGGLKLCATVPFACYPFPSNWPDPARIGSFFSGFSASLRRVVASVVNDCFFQFASALVAVESFLRTTSKRGSCTCGKLLSFSLFSARRWRAAWAQAPRQPARAQALLVAQLWARSLITIWPNRLWSAASSVLLQAKTALAADIALTRTEFSSLAGRGASPSGLFYFYAPARASGGKEPCSRRS
jgi:hypothetical protein